MWVLESERAVDEVEEERGRAGTRSGDRSGVERRATPRVGVARAANVVARLELGGAAISLRNEHALAGVRN
jgi:hypothetical protein